MIHCEENEHNSATTFLIQSIKTKDHFSVLKKVNHDGK